MSLTPCLDVSSPLTMGGGGYKTLLSPPGQPSHLQGWGLQKDPPCARPVAVLGGERAA